MEFNRALFKKNEARLPTFNVIIRLLVSRHINL